MKNIYLLVIALLLKSALLMAQTPCPNLVINGDFEVPNASFAFGLPLNTACAFNTYAITTRFNLKCTNLPPNFGDHTSGAGKFLIIENSNTVAAMWSTTVTVTPNTPYTFSFWASGALGNFSPEPLSANLAMSIDNGANLPLSISIGNNTGWIQYTYSGTTPAGVTNLAIAIKQITGGLGGSTYGIDDIVFTSCTGEPPCLACPTGVASANLVTNGSFTTTTGNVGFTSGLAGPFSSCGTNRYGITTDFPTFCNGWGPLSPHSGPTFLALDGDANPAIPTVLWQTPITLTANTNYNFSFWWALAFAHPSQNFPVSIGIVDATGAPLFGAAGIVGQPTISNNLAWTNTCLSWNSGSISGPQFIAIRQLTGSIYRDWAIDDICFTKSAIQPCKAEFTFQKIDSCGKVQFTNASVPTTGVTYCWDFDNNLATCESTAQNPLFQFPTCGTYNVGLIITGTDCKDTIRHTVTITDNIAPIARCKPSANVFLNPNCQYNVTTAFVDNGSTDNCSIKTLAVSPATITGCKNTTVTLTVTDWCNNPSTCTMSIQTTDTVPPVIICPPNISVTCTRDTTPSVTGVATATDNCFGTITFTHSDVITGTLPCNATIRRTWTARDTCGNVSSCVQSITVNDNVPPTIVCPQSYSVNTNLGFCYYTGTLTQPTATDNCGQTPTIICSLITQTSSTLITPQTQFPKGINTISCIARDACGNTSTTCTFTLTVVDNEKPKIICPLSISVVGTITPPATVCKAIVSGLAPTVTDNCPMWTVGYTISGTTTASGATDASGTIFMQGVSTVTYIVTDMAGNKDSCKFTVTVLCEGCACGNFVSLFYRPSQGAQSQAKVCGDTLSVPCNPQFSPVLTGAFNCTGVCSPTSISYEIRKPAGGNLVQSGVLTYPNFTLPLLASYFTSAGFYELTLIGQCGTAVSCVPCKFTLKVDSCCCQNRDQFIQAVKNAVTVSANNALCKATVNIGNLPTCDVLSNLQWGDGATSAGPFVAGDMPMHTYSGSGTYFISYLAVEKNASGQICFEYAGRDSVKLMCSISDTCRCGSFSNMTFRPAQGAQTLSVKCGDTLTLSCNTAFNPIFGGTFLCIGTNCRDSSIRWELRVIPSNSLVTSGNLTGPNFSIAIPSVNFATAGMYELTFFGQCGTQSCPPCKFKINVLPPISLSTGLTGYFPFNGNANDVSPTLINGIPTNVTLTFASNGTTSAYNFNGTSSVIIGTPDSRGVTDNVSVVAWIKTTETARGMWVAGQYNGGQARGYLLSIGDVSDMNIGQASFSGRVNLSNYYAAVSPPSVKVNNGQWHCLVGTAGLGISGTTEWRIYVDGILRGNIIGLTTPSVAPSAGSTHFTMGRHSDSNLPLMYYKGDMDDVRVYNKVLSQCEIDSLCSTRLVSGVGDKWDRMHLSIFPNPNAGTFTIELPKIATPSMTFRIIDLIGKMILEKQAEVGKETQTIEAARLPNGMYFLQVVLDGKVMGVEKFVKQ